MAKLEGVWDQEFIIQGVFTEAQGQTSTFVWTQLFTPCNARNTIALMFSVFKFFRSPGKSDIYRSHMCRPL